LSTPRDLRSWLPTSWPKPTETGLARLLALRLANPENAPALAGFAEREFPLTTTAFCELNRGDTRAFSAAKVLNQDAIADEHLAKRIEHSLCWLAFFRCLFDYEHGVSPLILMREESEEERQTLAAHATRF
jgi:hypothetical protein